MSLSSEELSKAIEEFFIKPLTEFREQNPQLFEPIRIIVVDDDGTETDLCDISRPLPEIMESIDSK